MYRQKIATFLLSALEQQLVENFAPEIITCGIRHGWGIVGCECDYVDIVGYLDAVCQTYSGKARKGKIAGLPTSLVKSVSSDLIDQNYRA